MCFEKKYKNKIDAGTVEFSAFVAGYVRVTSSGLNDNNFKFLRETQSFHKHFANSKSFRFLRSTFMAQLFGNVFFYISYICEEDILPFQLLPYFLMRHHLISKYYKNVIWKVRGA